MEKIKAEKKKQKNKSSFWGGFGLGEERNSFLSNLTMLIDAGIGILSSLEAIKKETRSKRMLKIIDEIKDDIESGSSLWQALDNVKIFSSQIISLVRIGEKSGRLSENLKVVTLQQQKDREFSSKIRSAMIYPIFVLSISIIVALGIAWFILPNLASVFLSFKINLPLITRIFVGIGQFFGANGSWFVPGFLSLFFLIIYFVFIFKPTKVFGEFLIINTPIIKDMIKQVEVSRFGFMLGNLLGAGLPIVEAINSLKETAGIYVYRNFYYFLKNNIEDGNSFQKSFEQYKKTNVLLSFSVQQMIITAEKSGRLPQTLVKIGEIFEDKIEVTTKNLPAVLEPILLVIVWLCVASIAIAVILPLYSLIGGIR
jgi:type IV pilus assembly protein PilC